MLEKFIFSFNGVQKVNPITMEEAIDIARKGAIAGRTIALRIGSVLLGTYYPNPKSPVTVTNPYTRETYPMECCIVECVPLKKQY